MTETERLREVKERMVNTRILFARQNAKTNFFEDIEWLMKQAEVAEELKKQVSKLSKKNSRLWKVNQELTADRDELRRRYESNKQAYINVQRGRADKRRKNRG